MVLGVVSSDTTEGTVSASSLTFTATTWSTAQTVTLTGVDDAPANPADGDQDYTVTLTVNMPSTVDPKYDALSSSPVTVYAVNADNEHGLKVSSVTGQATEAGGDGDLHGGADDAAVAGGDGDGGRAGMRARERSRRRR